MKSYPQIYSKVYEQPWLITPAKHRAIRMSLEAYLENPKAVVSEDDDEEDEDYKMMMDGDTAIIPIRGIIGKHLSMMETMCGGCDCEVVSTMIDAAEADGNCKRIFFIFDSPGGTVTGIPELARKIANCTKPTVGFCDTLCCSAALWLASQCQRFYCTESSDIGSVGVYCVYLDESKALEQEGIKVNAITAGKYKMAGASFRPMSDDERTMLQAGVDKVYGQFKEAVKRHREIADEYLQGQVYDGEEAVKFGFVDGLVENITEALDA